MEKNKFTTREKLKTYFQTGDYPTQSQFSELIDSLRHKEDVPTNREMVIIANSLVTLDNGYIQYTTSDVGDVKFSIVVSQKDEEDQEIMIDNSYGSDRKQYFLGNAPYTIKAKEFPIEELKTNEYYLLSYQINQDYIFKLIGNNLSTFPDGFEFGTMEDKMFILQIGKQNFGHQVNIVNTSIKFVNKTEVPIQYRSEAQYKGGNGYTSEDTAIELYDAWDYLYFYYKADLRETDRNILCKVYDADKDQLLMTGYLYAGQNNENAWGGYGAYAIRNIRIECDYQ